MCLFGRMTTEPDILVRLFFQAEDGIRDLTVPGVQTCALPILAPICWLMGVPWPQAITAGSLMGVKTVLNELIAYVDLSKLGPDALDSRSRLIMLYAMCGFANFGSLGIMIGGLGTMAPQRRDEINSLGLKSIVSGTLTTCLMGAIVGVLS